VQHRFSITTAARGYHQWHTMPLPDAENAIVPRRKLTDYLLSESHPLGRDKARYLRLYGFALERPEELEAALRWIAANGSIAAIETTNFGVKYVVVGLAPTPRGRPIRLNTVWIVEYADPRARFVTAYPARRRDD
jgi:hypothetical protein